MVVVCGEFITVFLLVKALTSGQEKHSHCRGGCRL